MPKFLRKRLGDIAAHIPGVTLHGDPDYVISGVGTLESASSEELAFLEDPSYIPHLSDTRAGAVILSPKLMDQCRTNALITTQPRLVYAKITQLLLIPEERPPQGVHPTAIIGRDCHIHPSAVIGPYCILGSRVHIGPDTCLLGHVQVGADCHIGANSFLYAHTTLYHGVTLGDFVIVHSGTVIGSDGFGFAPDHAGHWHKIPQFGTVRIGSHVEIGANVTIDRGAVGDTILEDGVILDNQIQIAHNVHIGAHTAIAGCSGISGSTKIGAHCLIGGGTCINGHITICDRVHISGMSMVTRSIHKSGMYSSGVTARENAVWLKNASRFHHLDDMAKRLKALEKKILSMDKDL